MEDAPALPERSPRDDAPSAGGRAGVASRAAALGVIALALVATYGGVWRAGIGQVVPVFAQPEGSPLRNTVRADVSYETWLVARHARTLTRRPWRLFDTEVCAPESSALSYGIPMIAMGLLAIPASLLTENPIAIYNLTLALQTAIGALAMLLLIERWTGVRAAALVAALLFAFHPLRLHDITHPSEWDIVWAVPALFFAERLLRDGRWRDALGLGAAIALQVAASFYQLLASAFATLPFGVWLLARYRPDRHALARLATALAGVAAITALLLGPYLAAHEQGLIGEREAFAFAPWGAWLPGGALFLGFALWALAACGLCAPRRLALPGLAGDPRAALCAGAALVAFVAAGPDTSLRLRTWGLDVPPFDPYGALAAWLPGLDSIRGVERLSSGVHLIACILAGAGSAALLRGAGRRAPALGVALAAAAWLACFGLPGLGRGEAWRLEPIHPSAERIAFFEQLALMGNRGPLLELPLDGAYGPTIALGASRILISGWHHRTTSACFGSFASPRREELAALAARLPERESVDALRALGFTTLLLHHPPNAFESAGLLAGFERAARAPNTTLEELQHTDTLSAFALLPAAGAAP